MRASNAVAKSPKHRDSENQHMDHRSADSTVDSQSCGHVNGNETGYSKVGELEDKRLLRLRRKQSQLWLKEPFVRLVACVLLVAFLPLLLGLILVVRLTSPGPGIYRQRRMGRNGRVFSMYKLRSMYTDAEKASGPVWSTKGDARITPLGKFLRLLHLDELPQLWNVARGEMAFVGPRPERPEIVDILARELPGYTDRLAVLPGITGLAQINLPPDETLGCVKRKLSLDIQYIESATLLLDLRIIGCTALRMIGLRHGRAVWLFGLERTPATSPEAGNDCRPFDLLIGGVGQPSSKNGNGASPNVGLSRQALDSADCSCETQQPVLDDTLVDGFARHVPR